MRILVLVIIALNFSLTALSQGIVISGDANATPHGSAMLDVQSTEKGFLPPRMTTTERNSIVSPASGLVVYDTNEESLFLFNGTEWEPLVAGSGSHWDADGDNIYMNSGNVGIGTSNPFTPLHVETSTSVAAIWGNNTSSEFNYGGVFQSSSSDGYGVHGLASSNSGSNYGGYFRSNSTSGQAIFCDAAANSGTTYGVIGNVNSPNGFAAYFTGASGSRSYFQRKVGIGILNPNELLEVAGNIHVSGDNRTIFNRSNNSLAFGTNNTERMHISSGGNVGIGTQPSYLLHLLSSSPSIMIENSGTSPAFLRFRRSGDGVNDHYIALGSSGQMVMRVSGTDQITIRETGNVGIGIGSPNFLLHVNGEAGKPGGGSWANASDARLKSDVKDLQGSLENLLKLRGVTFIYNDPEAIHELPGERIGMIAQEVTEVFPDWVNEANDGYLRLTYRGFEALMVEALRELREEKDVEIARLKAEKDAEIAQIKHDNEAHFSRLAEKNNAILQRLEILEKKLPGTTEQ